MSGITIVAIHTIIHIFQPYVVATVLTFLCLWLLDKGHPYTEPVLLIAFIIMLANSFHLFFDKRMALARHRLIRKGLRSLSESEKTLLKKCLEDPRAYLMHDQNDGSVAALSRKRIIADGYIDEYALKYINKHPSLL